MALQTKTINSSTTANGYALHLKLTENSVSTADNTSSVSWELYLSSGAWNFSQYKVGWSVSLNGTAVSSKSKESSDQISISKNGTVVIVAGTSTVAHGTDGALNMAASASIDMATLSYTPGPMSLTGTMALTNIARASTLTASDGTLGTATTMTINRADSSFKHTLTAKCGSSTTEILPTPSTTTTPNYTPSLTWASKNTTGTTVSVTYTLKTYKSDGVTQVGSAYTKTVTMTIPASVKPSCSAAVELVNDNATVNGWGVAVKGYSEYKVTTTFTGARGSTLKSRSVKISATGETLTGSPATSNLLASTTRTVKVKVKDSRDRWSDEVTVSGPVIYDYAAPTISTATAFRCDSNGTASDSGTYLSVKCKGSVSSCGGNNVRTVQYRKKTAGGSYGSWATLTNNTAAVVNAGLSSSTSYVVQFRVSDSLGNSRTVEVNIPTAGVTFNLRAGGKGAAFGKYAESDNELQVAWDLRLSSPLGIASGGTGEGARYEAVTFAADTSTASGHSVTVRRYPYLEMCFVRGSVTFDHVAVSENSWVRIGAVPAGMAPLYTTALTATKATPSGATARITNDGYIEVATPTAFSASYTYTVYFSGWWLRS